VAVSINWGTKVITVPQADLTNLGGGVYELDVDVLRLALKDLEDSEEGMAFPTTHNHNTEVTLSGVTYARVVEIINGYTVTFENGSYTVKCVGANHNLADVKTVNSVSLIIGNSAGLIVVSSGSGLSAGEQTMLTEIYQRLGLAVGIPLEQTSTEISTSAWTLDVSESSGTVTVERQP
jgi:hypothetical protein